MGLSLLETINGIDHISQTASFLRVKNKGNNKESRKQQHKYKGNTYSSIFPVHYCWMKVNGKAPPESARVGPPWWTQRVWFSEAFPNNDLSITDENTFLSSLSLRESCESITIGVAACAASKPKQSTLLLLLMKYKPTICYFEHTWQFVKITWQTFLKGKFKMSGFPL